MPKEFLSQAIKRTIKKRLGENLMHYYRLFQTKLNQFHNKKRHQRMLDFYSTFIQPGELVYDVGANVGGITKIFLDIGAKVVCIEPQDDCIEILQSKYGKNPNVTLIRKGIAQKNGKITLYICEKANTISTFSDKWKTGRFSNYKWTKTKRVPVTTLDSLIEEFGMPVFCKIDVEGFELQVLQGLSHPIPYISFEFTREFLDDAKSCVQHLLSIGNAQFNFSLGGSMQMASKTWMTTRKLFGELTSIQDNKMWGDIYVKFRSIMRPAQLTKAQRVQL